MGFKVCNKTLENTKTKTIQDKGIQHFIAASRLLKDGKHLILKKYRLFIVHESCAKNYVKYSSTCVPENTCSTSTRNSAGYFDFVNNFFFGGEKMHLTSS